MKYALAALLIVIGICSALFIDIYLLISGIIEIVHGASIIWGIVKIALREVVGAIVAIIFIGSGIAIASKN